MSLTDALEAASADDDRRARPNHPNPEVSFDVASGLPATATVTSDVKIEDATDHRKLIEDRTQIEVPADMDVRVEKLTLQDCPDGSQRWWYKYAFVPRAGAASANIDAAKILKDLRKNRKAVRPAYASDEATFGLVWADWQVGKKEGGGSEAFLDRMSASFDLATERARELQTIDRNLGTLAIFGNGDLVEGCTIFGNQPWQLDLDTRDQMNIAVTVALEGLDRLAPLFKRVVVMAVGGNHGENRMNGRKVNNNDNRDVELFENVARAAQRDPRLQHVEWRLAREELAKTIDLHGWIYAITHGQVFPSSGGSIGDRAYKWYAGQAAARHPAGDADVLITSHYHHYASMNWGACLWKQTGAMDGGSAHFSDVYGRDAAPGMLSFVVTPANRFQDQQVL